MQLIIRQIFAEDIDKLHALCDSTIENINGAHYNAQQIAAWRSRLTRQRWSELFNSRLTFIAAYNSDGLVVGFASIDPTGYLHSMFTHAEHQRQGVARALLTHVEKLARETGATEIRSDISITALPFFISMGFSVIKKQSVCINNIKMINFAAIKSL